MAVSSLADLRCPAMSTPSPFAIPPLILEFVVTTRPTLVLLLICMTWLGISIPLIIALFLFSSKQFRRKPIFYSNLLSVTVGLAMGILNVSILFQSIADLEKPISVSGAIAYTCLACGVPIFVEAILMFRLLAVYPFHRTPRRIFFSIFGPILLIKTGRIANFIIFMTRYSREAKTATSLSQLGVLSLNHPEPKIEWFLQVFDNTITTILFLWRLNQNRSLAIRVGGQSGKSEGSP
ncbi:hypothetical protein B0H10DRAFT_4695 [Mycena sp. CBHHK59/15]|nr:hypothetical protein B0H10DRAFT_4695 [Mycena sp. CBHHK59/15]